MKIDRKEFVRMWDAGVPAAKMAEHFGCHVAYISTFRQRNNIPRRGRVTQDGTATKPAGRISKPAAATPEPPRYPPGSILATEGKYALICEYAERHGMTYREALQSWHRERVNDRAEQHHVAGPREVDAPGRLRRRGHRDHHRIIRRRRAARDRDPPCIW